MGTTTPNLGLYKPDPGPPGETGWGPLVNANFDALDAIRTSTSLPTGWYNVADYGLLDDSGQEVPGTDNTAALQALIDSIPTAAAGEAVVFVWPKTQGKSYGFGDSVNWGNHSIRNIGLGSAGWDDQRSMTSVMTLADNMTIFNVDGGGGAFFHGPSFEHFAFTNGSLSYTGGKGIVLRQIVRCTLRRCLFYMLDIGIETEEAATDCAWHKFENLIFNQCNTGWKSISANSIEVISPDIHNCGIGFDLQLTNQTHIWGGKCNSPVVTTGVGTGNAAIGIRFGAGSYTNILNGMTFELGATTNGRTCISLGGDNITVAEIGMNGGGGATTNVGITIPSGGDGNRVSWRYAAGFADNAHIIVNSGVKNQIQYGAYVEATGNLPTSADMTRRGTIRHNLTTGVTQIANGTSWVSLAGPTSIVTKTADQSVNNSATLVDDTHLFLTLLGDSTSKYFLECFLLIDAVSAACDIKLAFTSGPATVRWAGTNGTIVTPSWGGVAVGTTGVLSDLAATTMSFGTVTAGATSMPLSVAAHVAEGSTSGPLYLRWAQDTATSGNLTLKAGSFMRITKIV